MRISCFYFMLLSINPIWTGLFPNFKKPGGKRVHRHNVPVNSKPDHPLGICKFSQPGDGVFAQLFWSGVGGFELEKFSTVLKEKMLELFDLFERNRRQLEKQVFLCCLISIFAKPVDVYCIFNNIDHFRPFRSIVIKFSSHPRVIFANARLSLKI